MLKGITYSFSPEKITAIVGRNGSGKSTLLNCMAGADLGYLGKTMFQQKDTTQYARHKMAKLGVLKTDQEPRTTISLTVGELIELSAPVTFHRGCLELAYRLLNHLPKEVLSQPLQEMSFGQRKIANLALMLLHEPQVLLLDEPVGGLSHDISIIIGKTLLDCKKLGLTIIVIEHDFDFLKEFADLALLLDEQKVAADGSARALLESDVVVKAFK